ncbi:MAG: hypothetical protein R3315_05670 [Woeseiaceae bacterium]|nr:hypothetical protein [Woeseiaceae bacterium]
MAELSAVGLFLVASAAIILLLNILVTRGLFRDSSISDVQRIAQLLFVWILPAVGAIVVYGFIAHHHTKEEMMALFPFPLNLIYREPLEPSGYNDVAEGHCGGGGEGD